MKRIFIALALILILPVLALAKVKTIICEGTYDMVDGETPTVAESRALLNAKRVAIEKAGTYVESYSKVKNLQLIEDEIKIVASGVMEVTILDKEMTRIKNGSHFWVKIKALVNSDKMDQMASKAKEKSYAEDYKRIQDAYDKSQKEIEELKKQLLQAKGDQKKEVQAKITADEKYFQANEWFEKGYKYSTNKEHDKAIEAYTKAIALNPELAEVYNNRGLEYKNKGQYDMAITDLNKAIELNPNYAEAYYNRGIAYYDKGQYDKALEYYSKAIELNPNYADAYNNRGLAYKNKGQYDMAITDLNKAIELNPNDAEAYGNRGVAYANKGQYDRAIEDFNKTITLNPNYAGAYNNRGLAYGLKGQYDKAMENYDKAIALNPNYANAYYNRGIAYYKKGNMDRAISDFQKACDMGYEQGCNNLQEALKNR